MASVRPRCRSMFRRQLPRRFSRSGFSLSAPMPWEQIEANQITIPNPEPEPAAEPMTAEVIEREQEATRLVPIASDQSKPAATGRLANRRARLLFLDANADSAAELGSCRRTPRSHHKMK